jgi:outer membrane receptor protein involved in Fe transport
MTLSGGPVTLSGQWRHLNSVTDDDPSTLYGSEKLAARDYFDISTLFDIGEHYQLGMGVSNLFDKKPPLAASVQNGGNGQQSNTFPTVYDVLGRTLFANARLKF